MKVNTRKCCKSIGTQPRLSRAIKIIHVVTRLDKGGSAEDTIVLVSGLSKDHYEVILVKGSSLESEMSPKEQYALLKAVEAAERNGARIIDLPFLVRRISPIDDLEAFLELFKIFRRERPGIVHTHTSKAGFLGRWAAFLARVPTIVHTPHGHVFEGYFKVVFTKVCVILERISALITDKIIAVSDRERNDYIEQRVGRKEKLVTIYSGVGLDRFADLKVDIKAKKTELGIPEDYDVVGTVGRLVMIKGHRYLVEAAKDVIKELPRTVFVFVGEGKLEGELREQARALGLTKNMIFIGWRSDVAEILYTFDIFAFPSLNEGMGKVLVEAMAACKPIVASKVGGIVDLVKEGVNGILVPPRDSAALSAGIVRLLADKGFARQLGRHGRQMIYPDFDVSARLNKLERLYEELGKPRN